MTPEEKQAIEDFKRLAESWPPTLALHVTGGPNVHIIKVPTPGSPAFDDLGQAKPLASFRFPTEVSCQ